MLGVVTFLFAIVCALLAYLLAGKASASDKEAKEAVGRERTTVEELTNVQKETKELEEERKEADPVDIPTSTADKLEQLRK